MNFIQSIPYLNKYKKEPLQVVTNSWSDRMRILESNVNLYCWKRPYVNSISNYLSDLIKHDLPNIQCDVDRENLIENLNEARLQWDQKRELNSNDFWNDVYQLSSDFLNLSRKSKASIHLRLVDNNSCIKFHMDAYELRLFTTYLGKGTEWLPEKATNRKGLGKSNSDIVKDVNNIQQMETYEVGILKGEPRNALNSIPGIVHRSPSIEREDGVRIILRIDI